MVLVAAGGLFAYGMQTVLWAVLADERLGVGTDAITLLYVASGIGGLLATIPASRAGSGRSAARILAAGAAIGGLSVAALGLAYGLPPAMALVGLQGFVISIVDILRSRSSSGRWGRRSWAARSGRWTRSPRWRWSPGRSCADPRGHRGSSRSRSPSGASSSRRPGSSHSCSAGGRPHRRRASEARVQLLAGLSLFAARATLRPRGPGRGLP